MLGVKRRCHRWHDRTRRGDDMGSDRSILRDVATTAGVSLRTASRVLNDDPRVAAATRERVQRVMQDLHYTPDLMARSLRAGRTPRSGSSWSPSPTRSSPSSSRRSRTPDRSTADPSSSPRRTATPPVSPASSTELLRRRSRGSSSCPTADDHSWLAEASAGPRARRPAGARAGRRRRRHRRPPRGLRRRVAPHRPRAPRIAYIGDYPAIATSAARLAGLPPCADGPRPARPGASRPRRLPHRGRSVDRDEQAARASPSRPTAVFSAATRCSLGVVPALHREGRTDIALVGFGDFPMADSLVRP